MLCRLFNMGNTHVSTAELSDSGEIAGVRTFLTESFDPDSFAGEPAAAVSVVPAFDHKLRNNGVFLLDSEKIGGIVSLKKMEHPETIGADRLANAAALVAGGKLPALSVDFGTAITFELVDEDRCLCGGAILPGRMLLRQVLHEHTAKLPMIAMEDSIIPVPGKNTVDAMRIGTDTGAVGAVREILSAFQKQVPGLRVVFCGGDAPFFLPYFPYAGAAVPYFTLSGLAYAFLHQESR